MEELSDEAQRRRAIAWATALTANTPLASQAYEQALLERFARGELDIDQVLRALDAQVQHVLYRSQAVRPFSHSQLTDLVEESRAYNQAHAITGAWPWWKSSEKSFPGCLPNLKLASTT